MCLNDTYSCDTSCLSEKADVWKQCIVTAAREALPGLDMARLETIRSKADTNLCGGPAAELTASGRYVGADDLPCCVALEVHLGTVEISLLDRSIFAAWN